MMGSRVALRKRKVRTFQSVVRFMFSVVFLRFSQGSDGLPRLFTVGDTFSIYVAKWPFLGAKCWPWRRVRQPMSKGIRQ